MSTPHPRVAHRTACVRAPDPGLSIHDHSFSCCLSCGLSCGPLSVTLSIGWTETPQHVLGGFPVSVAMFWVSDDARLVELWFTCILGVSMSPLPLLALPSSPSSPPIPSVRLDVVRSSPPQSPSCPLGCLQYIITPGYVHGAWVSGQPTHSTNYHLIPSYHPQGMYSLQRSVFTGPIVTRNTDHRPAQGYRK